MTVSFAPEDLLVLDGEAAGLTAVRLDLARGDIAAAGAERAADDGAPRTEPPAAAATTAPPPAPIAAPVARYCWVREQPPAIDRARRRKAPRSPAFPKRDRSYATPSNVVFGS